MAKARSQFVCQQCGFQSVKWLGKCPDCEGWDTLVEEVTAATGGGRGGSRGGTARAAAGVSGYQVELRALPPVEVPATLATVRDESAPRHVTGIAELDRVTGGGFVRGSITLLGGDPGIGKSTLMLQACEAVCANASSKHTACCYVTAEESAAQTRLRAGRLGVAGDRIHLACETNLERILATLEAVQPALAVIDSIQMLAASDLASAPGSVAQVRECTGRITSWAKSHDTAVVLVGHVTKSGAIAGPRVMEHLVDAVLSFEGDRFHRYRLLRASKNRFGPTSEIGVFEMAGDGLREVIDPAGLFLEDDDGGASDGDDREVVIGPDGEPLRRPGTAIAPVLEGTRTLLVEVQALVTRAVYGVPKRKVQGIDQGRVEMLLAVIEKRSAARGRRGGRLQMGMMDCYVNVVGGLRISEPGADLAVTLALVSSLRDVGLPRRTIVIGEVGLTGEVRPVAHLGQRLNEAVKLGFTRAIIPMMPVPPLARDVADKLELVRVRTLNDALDLVPRRHNEDEPHPNDEATEA